MKLDFIQYLNEEIIGLQIGSGNMEETLQILTQNENKFSHLYIINEYENDDYGYRQAIVNLDIHKSSTTLMRIEHSKTVGIFPDYFFNILFINSNINGIIEQWISKMKPDGIILGDYIGEEAKYIEKLCREYRFVLHVVEEYWFIKLDETESFVKMTGMIEF